MAEDLMRSFKFSVKVCANRGDVSWSCRLKVGVGKKKERLLEKRLLFTNERTVLLCRLYLALAIRVLAHDQGSEI